MITLDYLQKKKIKFFPLTSLGLKGYAYPKEDALTIIEELRKNNIPIIGGKVLVLVDNKIEYPKGYDNWFCDRLQNESWFDFVQRSCDISFQYVNRYSINNAFPFFRKGKIGLFKISYIEKPEEYIDISSKVNKVLAQWNPIGVPLDIADSEYTEYVPYIIDAIGDIKEVTNCLLSILRNIGVGKEVFNNLDITKIAFQLNDLANHQIISKIKES